MPQQVVFKMLFELVEREKERVEREKSTVRSPGFTLHPH